MKEVVAKDAPQPSGHYSQAIAHEGLLYVSGQLPIDPLSREKRVGSIEAQAEQALANLAAILKDGGSDKDHVLKLTVYISDISLWDRVDAAIARFFGEHRPARSVVPTRELHFRFQIEIDAIAAVKKA